MGIILLLSFLLAALLIVIGTLIVLATLEELDRWDGEAEDREELPTMTFKQIKPFVLLGKVEECQNSNYYSHWPYKTIFLCNGKKFAFTDWYELKKYNDFQEIIEKEKNAIKQRQNQVEFLKHLQKTVNAEYDKIAEEVKDKKMKDREYEEKVAQIRDDYGVGLGEVKDPDVEKVVRCMDCKYSRNLQTISEKARYRTGCVICTNGEISNTEFAMWGNDFCSYGERKEENV